MSSIIAGLIRNTIARGGFELLKRKPRIETFPPTALSASIDRKIIDNMVTPHGKPSLLEIGIDRALLGLLKETTVSSLAPVALNKLVASKLTSAKHVQPRDNTMSKTRRNTPSSSTSTSEEKRAPRSQSSSKKGNAAGIKKPATTNSFGRSVGYTDNFLGTQTGYPSRYPIVGNILIPSFHGTDNSAARRLLEDIVYPAYSKTFKDTVNFNAELPNTELRAQFEILPKALATYFTLTGLLSGVSLQNGYRGVYTYANDIITGGVRDKLDTLRLTLARYHFPPQLLRMIEWIYTPHLIGDNTDSNLTFFTPLTVAEMLTESDLETALSAIVSGMTSSTDLNKADAKIARIMPNWKVGDLVGQISSHDESWNTLWYNMGVHLLDTAGTAEIYGQQYSTDTDSIPLIAKDATTVGVQHTALMRNRDIVNNRAEPGLVNYPTAVTGVDYSDLIQHQ